MAAYRKRAKTTFMTPVSHPALHAYPTASVLLTIKPFTTQEQFSEEWDWVTECPIYTEPPPLTAGKYSWKTNLYQFALVSPPHRRKAPRPRVQPTR